MKKVSIIIVTHSQKDKFTQCLALLAQSLLNIRNKVEVIIIDNAAPHFKYIENLAASYGFKYIRNKKNLSFSLANEVGIKASKGKYILLLNDDTIPSVSGWIEKLLAFADKNPKAGVVGCKLLYPQNHKIQHCGIAFNQYRQPFHPLLQADMNDPRTETTKQVQAVTFACALIRRKIYDEVGGFTHLEEKPGYHYEDVDLCFKVRKAGYEVWYKHDAIVFHYSASSFAGKLKTKEENFKFLPNFIKKWFIEIKHDDWKSLDIPAHNPEIAIGIPLTDGSRWRFKQHMNMISGLNYWKKKITLIFSVDNCSQDFHEEIQTWAKLNIQHFKDIRVPSVRTHTDGKVQSVIVNRNLIREDCIRLGYIEYLFFIDTDVIIEKDTLKKLMPLCETGGADIAAGVYFYKIEDNPKPMLFESRLHSKKFKGMTQDKKIKHSSYKMERVIGLGNFAVAKHLMDGGVHEAGATHMGCTLIKMKCLKELPFEYENCYGTEDLSWFSRAEEKGFKLVVDTGLKLFHLDANGFVYCWWNMDLKDDKYVYKLKPVKEKI